MAQLIAAEAFFADAPVDQVKEVRAHSCSNANEACGCVTELQSKHSGSVRPDQLVMHRSLAVNIMVCCTKWMLFA